MRSWADLMDSWHLHLSSCLAPESNVKTLLFFPLGNVASFVCLLRYFGSPAAHSVSMAGIPCPHVGVPCAQCSAGWVGGHLRRPASMWVVGRGGDGGDRTYRWMRGRTCWADVPAVLAPAWLCGYTWGHMGSSLQLEACLEDPWGRGQSPDALQQPPPP